MTREPNETSKRIKIKVRMEGENKHSVKETNKRHVTGDTRERLANELDRKGITNWYYREMAATHPASRAAGNIHMPKNLDVLHKLTSEGRQYFNLSTDVLQEVKLLQDILHDMDTGKVLPGFIHNTFKVTLFSQDQLLLYNSSCHRVLHLDATGSIVQKIQVSKNHIIMLWYLNDQLKIVSLCKSLKCFSTTTTHLSLHIS